MPSIDEVRSAFARYRPQIVSDWPKRRAAVVVALCERPGEELQVLFIERASRQGDPWSGHMAFPGGRVDDTDASPQAAAQRETLEEVGLSLAGCELLGQLDDSPGLPGTARELVVSAFVFQVIEPQPLVTNHEVRKAFWFPVESLLDSRLHIEHQVVRGTRTHFPGILVGDPGRHVVWGLTYRFLESFLQIIGQPLPERWKFDQDGTP
jgi:8-oxo-dGTP pyrophosphatase MutT (NUDIX family)